MQNIDYRIRIFVRDSRKASIAKDAFEKYTKKHGGFMHPMTEGLDQHNIREEYKTRPVNNSADIP